VRHAANRITPLGDMIGIVSSPNPAVAAVVVSMLSGCALGQANPSSDPQLHERLDWRRPGSCVVDFVHTPCRTVRYHEYSFGSSLGFDGITNSESVEAVDHDGSESNTTKSTHSRFWFFPQQRREITELVLRQENRTMYIDHGQGVYETHLRGANKKMPYWENDDSQCSNAKSHALYLSARLPDSKIAGVNVVGYRGRDKRGAEYEVYFAPSLGCQMMRFHEDFQGILGFTTAEYDKVVDSYEIGPPSPNLFKVPSGFKQVASISR
jgi:hypothetical protein